MLSVIKNPEIMLLPTQTGISMIDISTIVRVQSISNYSKLFFKNGKTLVVAKLLSWFEGKLPHEYFIRIHRSHLVNLLHVQGYCNSNSGRIILNDNTSIDISRRKKARVMKFFRVAA
jgi:two-component system, LytTR family, response regulator